MFFARRTVNRGLLGWSDSYGTRCSWLGLDATGGSEWSSSSVGNKGVAEVSDGEQGNW